MYESVRTSWTGELERGLWDKKDSDDAAEPERQPYMECEKERFGVAAPRRT